MKILNDDNTLDIETFIKLAPLGLKVRTINCSAPMYYKDGYFWYGNDKMYGAWKLFNFKNQYTSLNDLGIKATNFDEGVDLSYYTDPRKTQKLIVLEYPKGIINFNHTKEITCAG